MTTVIKLPLRSVNAETIRELQEKYPQAEMSVEVHSDPNQVTLSEERFWDIVQLLDWSKEGDDDAVLEPAVAALADEPIRHIYEFADLLAAKLFALDGQVFAEKIGADAYRPDRYFSVDNFLYARCCVIANGREFFEDILSYPEKMPQDLTFEALLDLPSLAYERKAGKTFDYVPAFPIETYSNKQGWGGRGNTVES